MKKLILFLLVAPATLGLANAQKMIVKTYVEKTHLSPKTGTAIGFENRFKWEYGAFFQEASLMESFMMSKEDIESLPRHYEKEFSGIYFAIPLMVKEQFMVKTNVRTGVSNGENFVITTSFLADFMPVKHFHIGMGIGSRAFRPTMQASISLSF